MADAWSQNGDRVVHLGSLDKAHFSGMAVVAQLVRDAEGVRFGSIVQVVAHARPSPRFPYLCIASTAACIISESSRSAGTATVSSGAVTQRLFFPMTYSVQMSPLAAVTVVHPRMPDEELFGARRSTD
jgi:hypothetical protein